MGAARLEIVPLQPEEAAAAALLLAGYVSDDTPGAVDIERCREAVAHHLGAGGDPFLLAHREGVWAGFVHLGWGRSTSTGRPVLRVQGLYTAPAHCRRGVAGALPAHASELASLRAAARLQLGVDGGNVAARRLYERCGFELLSDKQVYMKFL